MVLGKSQGVKLTEEALIAGALPGTSRPQPDQYQLREPSSDPVQLQTSEGHWEAEKNQRLEKWSRTEFLLPFHFTDLSFIPLCPSLELESRVKLGYATPKLVPYIKVPEQRQRVRGALTCPHKRLPSELTDVCPGYRSVWDKLLEWDAGSFEIFCYKKLSLRTLVLHVCEIHTFKT